jgi:hypothetical protein
VKKWAKAHSAKLEIMSWLSRIFNFVPSEERKGLHIDLGIPVWKVSSPKDFTSFLRALIYMLPPDSIAYFEGGSPSKELRAFFKERAIPEVSHIEIGTIWPRPEVFHIPATSENLLCLAAIAERCAKPQVAIHFHIYRNNRVLLQWYDAFFDPMFISKEIAEDKIKKFCANLAVSYGTYKQGFGK